MRRKLILRNFQSPGDILMLTAAVRDLHLTHPGHFETDVRTPCPALWEHNPYLTPLSESDPMVESINCEYPLVHQSNELPYHFIHGFRLFLEEVLQVRIRPHAFRGDVHLSDEEKRMPSQVSELADPLEHPFWIIVAGGKTDFTAKWWDPARYQAVVEHFRGRLQFVQCGELSAGHVHPPLKGVIDLRGRTDLRQLLRLVYHADGVLCPVTMLMHAAAAVETPPGRSRSRPCVVVAGGREPAHWEAYPHHQFLHTCGCLPCCEQGGCWRSRVQPLGDGDPKDDDLCLSPVQISGGCQLPRCMDMISVDSVIVAIEHFLQFDVEQRSRPEHRLPHPVRRRLSPRPGDEPFTSSRTATSSAWSSSGS